MKKIELEQMLIEHIKYLDNKLHLSSASYESKAEMLKAKSEALKALVMLQDVRS